MSTRNTSSRETMQYLCFLAHSLNDLAKDHYGMLAHVPAIDKVFQDLFGVKKFGTRIYTTVTAEDFMEVVKEVGGDNIFKIFDNSGYREALFELVNTQERLMSIRAKSKSLYRDLNKKKANQKPKRKRQDLVCYNSYIKEIRYATDVYDAAIKKLRKCIGVKNPNKKGFVKERYNFLKNFAKKNDDGFYHDGFMENDTFFGDSAFDDIPMSPFIGAPFEEWKMPGERRRKSHQNDDEDDDENSLFNQFKNSHNFKKSQKVKNRSISDHYPTFINGPEDIDEDDYEDDDEDEDVRTFGNRYSNYRVDPEIDKKFDDVNHKLEYITHTLAAILPGGKEALNGSTEPLPPAQDEMIGRIVSALDAITKKVDSLHDAQVKLVNNDKILDDQQKILAKTMQNMLDTVYGEDDEDDDEENEEEIEESYQEDANNAQLSNRMTFSMSPEELSTMMDSESDSVVRTEIASPQESFGTNSVEHTEWQKREAEKEAILAKLREENDERLRRLGVIKDKPNEQNAVTSESNSETN